MPAIRYSDYFFFGVISRSDNVRAYNVGLMRKQKDQLAQDRSAFRKGAGLEFVEIKVELNCLGSGKRLADISQPQNTNVVSILRHGSVLVPDGNTKILPGDVITILCFSNQIEPEKKFYTSHE
ncbi:TrkA C-terminal domain-containing protein [Thermodesulfobacteriota bacterium]